MKSRSRTHRIYPARSIRRAVNARRVRWLFTSKPYPTDRLAAVRYRAPMEEEQVIAGYRVVRRLGAGGMGEVFLVQHPRLPRQDALKLLDVAVSRNGDFKARFQREADLMATLNHPNIVTLHDRGEFEGRLWLSMEYVDGADAAHILRDRGPMPLDRAIEVIAGAGTALDFAWEHHRITHRDVKPANILVAELPDGTLRSAKLADFGIAKAAGESTSLTSTGVTIGTMAYISPEALNAEPVDNRSDIYSLGCAAFQLLTGSTPFEAPNISALMAAHMTRTPPPITSKNSQLPAHLDGVFARVLAKTPKDRFQSCADFVVALREAGTAVPSPASVPESQIQTMVRSTPGAPPRKLPPSASTVWPAHAARGGPRKVADSPKTQRRWKGPAAFSAAVIGLILIGYGFVWARSGYYLATDNDGKVAIYQGRFSWLGSHAETACTNDTSAAYPGAETQPCRPLRVADLTPRGRSMLDTLSSMETIDDARSQARTLSSADYIIPACKVTTDVRPSTSGKTSARPTTATVTQTSSPASPCRTSP